MSEDQELKKLQSAMKVPSSELDVQRWKSAVKSRKSFLERQASKPWFQWIVAASIGFIIGAATFSQIPGSKPLRSAEHFSNEDATFEQIYIKDN